MQRHIYYEILGTPFSIVTYYTLEEKRRAEWILIVRVNWLLKLSFFLFFARIVGYRKIFLDAGQRGSQAGTALRWSSIFLSDLDLQVVFSDRFVIHIFMEYVQG